MTQSGKGSFDPLTPDAVIAAVEQTHGCRLDGTVTPYPSYVNRVFGLRTDEGAHLVVKVYRPGRWSRKAILEEHDFLEDCRKEEIPVVVPMRDSRGDTLSELTASDGSIEEIYFYALFPKMGGRSFDAESDEDWFRLGTIVGRCHVAGRRRKALFRESCHPVTTTGAYIAELLENDLIHPDCGAEFEALCTEMTALIAPLFDGVEYQRIHGDCHRGNILDRGEEGLLLYDFDDMANGPAVQDIWLLLPDYAYNCRRELAMLLDGYEQFSHLKPSSLPLIEPLRFMRMVYFLVWRSRQRHDFWFQKSFPGWGSEAFWMKEIEDLRVQHSVIRDYLSRGTP